MSRVVRPGRADAAPGVDAARGEERGELSGGLACRTANDLCGAPEDGAWCVLSFLFVCRWRCTCPHFNILLLCSIDQCFSPLLPASKMLAGTYLTSIYFSPAACASPQGTPTRTALLPHLTPAPLPSLHQAPEGLLFDGGAAQFPQRLAAQIGPDRIKLGEPVLQIRQTGVPETVTPLRRILHSLTGDTSGTPGVTVVTLHGSYRARAVIVAMPPHLTGRIWYTPPMPATRDQLTQRMPMVS